MIIRREIATDAETIEEVIASAFERAPHTDHTEHLIVEDLRKAGALSLSLVAVVEGEVVGHVAFSPVTIEGRACAWFGLGPVSVAPSRQRLGIGSQLIRAGLTELRQARAHGCVVLGDPAYYSRFGFSLVPALELPDAPAVYFQALVLNDKPDAVPESGIVRYHPAFTQDRKG